MCSFSLLQTLMQSGAAWLHTAFKESHGHFKPVQHAGAFLTDGPYLPYAQCWTELLRRLILKGNMCQLLFQNSAKSSKRPTVPFMFGISICGKTNWKYFLPRKTSSSSTSIRRYVCSWNCRRFVLYQILSYNSNRKFVYGFSDWKFQHHVFPHFWKMRSKLNFNISDDQSKSVETTLQLVWLPVPPS